MTVSQLFTEQASPSCISYSKHQPSLKSQLFSVKLYNHNWLKGLFTVP